MHSSHVRWLFLALGLTTVLSAQTDKRSPASTSDKRTATTPADPRPGTPTNGTPLTNPNAGIAADADYRLAIGDQVSFSVHGEPEFDGSAQIDKKGLIKIPVIKEISLANKTVREAEAYVERVFVERKQLRHPEVRIVVTQYASREVTVMGTGANGGVFVMPRETDSIEIVELITRMGGFKPTAKSDKVKVTRVDETGKETVFDVDVESMIYGGRNAKKSFLIYPGDKILVNERVF